MSDVKMLIEAREIVANEGVWSGDYRQQIIDGELDETPAVRFALAALKRGMELAQPPLTREQLGDAIVNVFREGAFGFGRVTPNEITRLHAALTERQP